MISCGEERMYATGKEPLSRSGAKTREYYMILGSHLPKALITGLFFGGLNYYSETAPIEFIQTLPVSESDRLAIQPLVDKACSLAKKEGQEISCKAGNVSFFRLMPSSRTGNLCMLVPVGVCNEMWLELSKKPESVTSFSMEFKPKSFPSMDAVAEVYSGDEDSVLFNMVRAFYDQKYQTWKQYALFPMVTFPAIYLIGCRFHRGRTTFLLALLVYFYAYKAFYHFHGYQADTFAAKAIPNGKTVGLSYMEKEDRVYKRYHDSLTDRIGLSIFLVPPPSRRHKHLSQASTNK